ncbi:hypothetical protein DL764_006817 [Monosporascus ibericus]|uniref:N-acetyltransferase domain-containing protein n=1 Tax=Monosporascus ibericus TaxID=155417 RepID=A0A4Q4T5S3_9PEZI|nr:hypothetical protein DL764_006817 [Monosporascus ibericus]
MGGGDCGPGERLTLRRATLGDLDDVLTVVLESLSDDPKFDYRFRIGTSTQMTTENLGVPDGPNVKVIRRDVNPTHYRQWKKQMIAGFEEYFGKYGIKQWHLWVLCTLPAFKRPGAETRLYPNGKKLYEKLGFDLRGSFTIRVEGEEEVRQTRPPMLTMAQLTYRTKIWLSQFEVAVAPASPSG